MYSPQIPHIPRCADRHVCHIVCIAKHADFRTESTCRLCNSELSLHHIFYRCQRRVKTSELAVRTLVPGQLEEAVRELLRRSDDGGMNRPGFPGVTM